MWRVVFEKFPRGGRYHYPGPWLSSQESAKWWLDFFRPYYPTAWIQPIVSPSAQGPDRATASRLHVKP